jgi:hypothetical protein
MAAEWMLDHLGCIQHWSPKVLKNWTGTNVGEIRISSGGR